MFKAEFRDYVEDGYVDLVQPRFPAVKVETVGVIQDIRVRVVWNSKSNGYNACLWAPGFMLPMFIDALELVVRWLPLPVGRFLAEGSPSRRTTRTRGS